MLPHFYSVNEYLKGTYGVKMYKLALNGGMNCPKRDGLIDTRGCIFCSAGGSGDFACTNVDDAKNLYQINIQEIILLHTSSPIPIHMQMSAI